MGRKVSTRKGLLLNVDQPSVATGGRRVVREQTWGRQGIAFHFLCDERPEFKGFSGCY